MVRLRRIERDSTGPSRRVEARRLSLPAQVMAVHDRLYEGSAAPWGGGWGSNDMFEEMMYVVAFARDCSALEDSLAPGWVAASCYEARPVP